MSNGSKVAKKGDVLFKEGDKINSIFLIQSGGINQCLIKNKKPIDLFQIGANQILNDGALFGQTTATTSAIATTEVQYLELPAELLKAQVEASSPILKSIIKSLSDRLRLAISEVKSTKSEKDSSPLPDDQIAKAFGVIYHTASHKGERGAEGKITVDWVMMKQYAQRIFGESPKRLEQALCLLVKLKYAEFVMGKPVDDPDGADELHKVVFKNLMPIQNFFEFFQYHYFKNGRTDLLKYDEGSFKLVDAFLKLTEKIEADRFGVVTIEYSEILEGFKKNLNMNLSADHFTRLEQRGVYSKRLNVEKRGVLLQFERKEYENVLFNWRIIAEIDKWNNKGFVDMAEEENKQKGPAQMSCPGCQAPYKESQKFCGECGFKIAA